MGVPPTAIVPGADPGDPSEQLSTRPAPPPSKKDLMSRVTCSAKSLPFHRILAAMALASGCLQCVEARAEDAAASARTFYVDSDAGNDANDGLAVDRAWQSLQQVEAAELRPGDTVCFRCGGAWRGSLTPASGDEGAPVTYTSFGEGPKPLILGSRPRNRAEDWVQVADHLWATLPMEYQRQRQVADLRKYTWGRHQEAGAQVAVKHVDDPAGRVVQLACTQSGERSNHVQLWGPEVPVEKGQYLVFTFRARCTKPFCFPGLEIINGRAPWTGFARSTPANRSIGPDWDTYEVVLKASATSPTGRMHVSLGGVLPAGAVLDFQPQSLHVATPNIADPLTVDVGNIIFDGGAVCGWKKWSVEDLTKPYDYYYDRPSQRVYLYCDANPASQHKSIELAMARHVIHQSGKHHIVYDGLAIMYGAAHGFGGGNTHHIVIRNCDLGYIGGAHQHTRPDGKPVRFGNAIEFWGAARDNLVEGCHIWEVYDAALTNQGRGPDSKQINITYRNNLIRNSEYSFEYWNNPETAVTENIRFVNNMCINAGTVWSHAQRPDQNGSHLMFYTNTAATSGIEVKYNIFYNASDWGSRYSAGWKVRPEMDYNLWFSDTGIAARWFREKIGSFEEYQKTTGLDAHSQFADPQFVDVNNGDYRLRSDSPARSLRPDGGPVGVEDLFRAQRLSDN